MGDRTAPPLRGRGRDPCVAGPAPALPVGLRALLDAGRPLGGASLAGEAALLREGGLGFGDGLRRRWSPVNCRERLALRLGLSSSSEDPLPPPLPPLVCRPNSASRAPGTRSSSRSQYAASLAFTDNTRASCFKEAGDCTGEPGALGAGDRPVLGDLRPLAVGPGLCPRDDAWPCRLDRWGAADTGRDVVPLLAPRPVVGPGLGGKGVRSVASPAPWSPPPLLRGFLAPPPSSSRSLRGLPPPGRRTGRLRREDWGRDDVGLGVAVAVGAPDGVLGWAPPPSTKSSPSPSPWPWWGMACRAVKGGVTGGGDSPTPPGGIASPAPRMAASVATSSCRSVRGGPPLEDTSLLPVVVDRAVGAAGVAGPAWATPSPPSTTTWARREVEEGARLEDWARLSARACCHKRKLPCTLPNRTSMRRTGPPPPPPAGRGTPLESTEPVSTEPRPSTVPAPPTVPGLPLASGWGFPTTAGAFKVAGPSASSNMGWAGSCPSAQAPPSCTPPTPASPPAPPDAGRLAPLGRL